MSTCFSTALSRDVCLFKELRRDRSKQSCYTAWNLPHQASPWRGVCQLSVCPLEYLHRVACCRKCLIMFNWLTPVTSILAEHSASPAYGTEGTKASLSPRKPLLYTFLHASPPILLELAQSVADDVYTWSKLGLLGRRTGEHAGRFADCCWLASTLVELVENHVEHTMIITSQRAGEFCGFTSS